MKINVFHPRDIIAIVVILGALTLLALGIDGIVATVLLAVVGFYFGLNTKTPRDD